MRTADDVRASIRAHKTGDRFWDGKIAIAHWEAYVAEARRELGEAEWDRRLKSDQERREAQQRTVAEHKALAERARARGDRVPSQTADPDAYYRWLQQERIRDWTIMGRANNRPLIDFSAGNSNGHGR